MQHSKRTWKHTAYTLGRKHGFCYKLYRTGEEVKKLQNNACKPNQKTVLKIYFNQ